jgi:hypothetical protein
MNTDPSSRSALQRAFADPLPADPLAAARIRALAAGEVDPALDAPLLPEDRPLPIAPLPLPTVAELVRIATDIEPDAGCIGPDLVLGPLADEADVTLLRAATAWSAWINLREVPALVRRSRDRRVPRSVRATLVAVHRAPPAPWRVVARDGDSIVVDDVVGLGTAAPTGPVRCEARVAPGDLLLSPIAVGPDGPVAVAPIVVPRSPPLGSTRAAVRAARAADPRVRTMADVLRTHGHVLARGILTEAWRR